MKRVSATEHRLEHEAWSVQEDAVVRDDRDAEVNRRRCDPTIGIAASLGQRVTDPVTGKTKGDRRFEELRPRPYDLSPTHVCAGSLQPLVAPGCATEPELELCDRLERHHDHHIDQLHAQLNHTRAALDTGVASLPRIEAGFHDERSWLQEHEHVPGGITELDRTLPLDAQARAQQAIAVDPAAPDRLGGDRTALELGLSLPAPNDQPDDGPRAAIDTAALEVTATRRP